VPIEIDCMRSRLIAWLTYSHCTTSEAVTPGQFLSCA
jgi:hypothetical protein